jgi:hypothetical protein
MAHGVKTGGRQKGTPNKTTALLRDAILQAAEEAGEGEGLVAYLKVQAIDNPGPFMSLLGKVLPTQVTGDSEGGPIKIITGVEYHVVYPDGTKAPLLDAGRQAED